MIRIYCLQIRHFLDFTPDGPLCHMLSTLYQFKNEQGWRRFDLSSPSRKDANLEMCQKVEEVLEKKRFHVNPKLFLHKDLTKEDKEKVTKFHPHLSTPYQCQKYLSHLYNCSIRAVFRKPGSYSQVPNKRV